MDISQAEAINDSLKSTALHLEDLALLNQGDIFHRVMRNLDPHELSQKTSDASVLQALLFAGIHTVEERSQFVGYREMAAQLNCTARKKVARRR